MTCIVWRDNVLAADSASTFFGDAFIIRQDIPKIAMYNNRLAGAAGSASFHGSFIRWFMRGTDHYPPPATDENDVGVIVERDGGLTLYDATGWFKSRPPYFAMGSGAAVALGALYQGADAVAAVRAAIEHDPFTSGDVTVLRLIVED